MPCFELGWFAHPLFSRKGDYPTIMRKAIDKNSRRAGYYPSRLPVFSRRWIRKIRGSVDFLGLNYYTSRIVESLKRPLDQSPEEIFAIDAYLNYSVKPEWKRAKTIYGTSRKNNNPCVLKTRNGWSDDGQLYDPDRIKYLRAHLKQVLRALNESCNVDGYTAWSLYNSFDYRDGYTTPFGLYDVNFASPLKELTPKASAEFMREVASAHCLPEN